MGKDVMKVKAHVIIDSAGDGLYEMQRVYKVKNVHRKSQDETEFENIIIVINR